MLTGDKGETAHQIAYSCGMYLSEGDSSFKAFKFDEVPYGKMITSRDLVESQTKMIDDMLSCGHKFGFTLSGTHLVTFLNDPA